MRELRNRETKSTLFIFFLKLVFQSESVHRLPWEIRRSEITLTLIKNKRKTKNKGNYELTGKKF